MVVWTINKKQYCLRGSSKLDRWQLHVGNNCWLEELCISSLVQLTLSDSGSWLCLVWISDSPKRILWFTGNWIMDPLNGIIRFPAYPTFNSPRKPPFGTSWLDFWVFHVQLFAFIYMLVSSFCGAILGCVLWHNSLGFYFFLPRIWGNYFSILCLWSNKRSFLLILISFFLPLHWRCFLPLYSMLPLVLVVASGPFLLGPFVWMSFSGSFQIILPILLSCLILWHFSLRCILHALSRFPGALLYQCVEFWFRKKYLPDLICASSSEM